MPLNLSAGNDGDFMDYLSYNAKAGRFYAKPKGGGEACEVQNPRLAIDMQHIRTGWIYYQEGIGPEKVWDPSPTQMAPQPPGPKKFRRGFELLVYGADNIPGIGQLELREFSSTAQTVISSILTMYDDYERGAAQNVGKIPFFKCEKVRPIQGTYGTNYEPIFTIIGWVDRRKIPAFDAVQRPVVQTAPSRGVPPAASEADFGLPAKGGVPGFDDDLDDRIPF